MCVFSKAKKRKAEALLFLLPLNKKKTMFHNKTCGICSASMAGQAMFTSECSHGFHFSCFNDYVSRRNRLCPVCLAAWSHHLPFFSPPPIQHFPPPTPLFRPEYNPCPLIFNDDEPIPNPTPANSSLESQKLIIRVIPEHKAMAPSRSSSQFAVLVRLKAPPLSSRRAPVDIVAVLDVSGSMYGQKLDLVKRAVCFVIDNLGASDRLSVVSFSDRGVRVLPLRRMTDAGREDAKRAVGSLAAAGGTNIVDGLTKGVRILDERRYENPVAGIVFLSDGNDTYNRSDSLFGVKKSRDVDGFMKLLPSSISPRKPGSETGVVLSSSPIPVHSFGFGSDHDPIIMHAISDASGGTFSFIESIESVQDAFASCIGGLLSVVIQELKLKLRSASHGVEIKSIPSGRYTSEITKQGSEGVINVGDLYADKQREFLIDLSVPESSTAGAKTSLLDITCSYRDALSEQTISVESELVEIRRPEFPSPQDLEVNVEVDRERNRLRAAESIRQAQQMAEAGDLSGARHLLFEKRSSLMGTAAAQAGDGMMKWLEGEMKETEIRFGSSNMYQQSGRAFALSGMSAHASQRAVFGAAAPMGGGPAFGSAAPVVSMGYSTPYMANMVAKSQQQQQQQQQNGEGEENNTCCPMEE